MHSNADVQSQKAGSASELHCIRVGVPAETGQGERRVALVPERVARLTTSGYNVTIEAGAGERADFTDGAYRAAGAMIERERNTVLSTADVVLAVQPLSPEHIALLRTNAVTISFLQPATQRCSIEACVASGVTAFSLDFLPRSSRAQSMDALSSQSSLAGYKAVLMAANRLNKFFPMLITAAGTIPPARVLVLGAGVAGLQAIATAHRLGAVVEAYDVRPAVREEVKSLGAHFLELDLASQEGAETAGAYAHEQSELFLARQRILLTEHVATADVVITTAAVPGRQAPRLLTTPMVKNMHRGAVIVDLAAEAGGNCEGTLPGQVVEINGVWLDGTTNIPSTMAFQASQLYARNISNLLQYLVHNGELTLDFKDEIVAGSCITHAGQIVNARARQLMTATTPPQSIQTGEEHS